jgi:hypothetical protein
MYWTPVAQPAQARRIGEMQRVRVEMSQAMPAFHYRLLTSLLDI